MDLMNGNIFSESSKFFSTKKVGRIYCPIVKITINLSFQDKMIFYLIQINLKLFQIKVLKAKTKQTDTSHLLISIPDLLPAKEGKKAKKWKNSYHKTHNVKTIHIHKITKQHTWCTSRKI